MIDKKHIEFCNLGENFIEFPCPPLDRKVHIWSCTEQNSSCVPTPPRLFRNISCLKGGNIMNLIVWNSTRPGTDTRHIVWHALRPVSPIKGRYHDRASAWCNQVYCEYLLSGHPSNINQNRFLNLTSNLIILVKPDRWNKHWLRHQSPDTRTWREVSPPTSSVWHKTNHPGILLVGLIRRISDSLVPIDSCTESTGWTNQGYVQSMDN